MYEMVTKIFVAGLAALAFATAFAAAEVETRNRGEALHDEHCLSCHGTSVYTREERMIRSPEQLRAQVARCAAGPAGVDWSRRQIDAVTAYLNQAFYGF